MSGAGDDGPDGLVDALRERIAADLERGAATFRLALAETRLAANSGLLLIGIALAIAVLAVLIWLLLVALAGYELWRLGLSPALSLGVLLGLHVGAALALALLARRLVRDLGFVHTRRALADAVPRAPTITGAPPDLPEAPGSVPRARD